MSKLLIISSAIIVGILGATPFAIDKYVSSKVTEKFESEKAQILKLDPTLSITYGDVFYSVFEDLVTVKDISYYSVASGIDLSINKVVFTPIDNGANWEELPSIPNNALTTIDGGKVGFRGIGFTQREKDIVSFIAGQDKKIEFSMKMSSEFDEKLREYNYYNDFYVENIGTYDLNFTINGFDPDSKDVQSLDQGTAIKYLMENVSVNNFNLSFTTQNVKRIADELFMLKNYVKNDDEFTSELEKLASKMESEESMKGFSKPIRDFSKSYTSNKEITLSFVSDKNIKINNLIMAVTATQIGGTAPQTIADHLGIKVISEVK
jgi:hypothetical protein